MQCNDFLIMPASILLHYELSFGLNYTGELEFLCISLFFNLKYTNRNAIQLSFDHCAFPFRCFISCMHLFAGELTLFMIYILFCRTK